MSDGAIVQSVGVDADMALLGVRFCEGGCGALVSREFCEECTQPNVEFERRRAFVAAHIRYQEARRMGQLLDLPMDRHEADLPGPGDALHEALQSVKRGTLWVLAGALALCGLAAGMYGLCWLVQALVALLLWGSR